MLFAFFSAIEYCDGLPNVIPVFKAHMAGNKDSLALYSEKTTATWSSLTRVRQQPAHCLA